MTTTTDVTTEGATLVRIALPIPLDIVGQIMKLVGTLYPNSTVKTQGGDHMVLCIPDSDRYLDDDDDTLDSASPATRGSRQAEAILEQIKDGVFSISEAEFVGRLFAGIFGKLLDDSEAPNYLQITMAGADGQHYAVIVCRPGQPSPHDLREAAEAKAERYATRLRELGEDPDAL